MSEIPPKDSANQLSAEDLLALLNVAYQLQKALAHGDTEVAEQLAKRREELMQLLEYIVANIDNPNIDKTLLPMLQQMLGIDARDVAQEMAERDEEEKEQTKEEIERINKVMIYEIYKIVNPHRLAGETAMDNFIKNVKTRGIKEAMKYEGAEYAKDMHKDDLKNLEAYKQSHLDALHKSGSRGGGIGR